jgi:hypothetical protein
MRNGRVLWILVASAAMGGCPSNAKTGPTAKADAAVDDAGLDAGGDAGEELTVYCPDGTPDSSSLVSGYQATSADKKLIATFVQSDPSPPQRYNNVWTVDFTDATGAPVADMAMTKSSQTWMPYHGHGWPASWMPMAQPGRFEVTLNFNMRGDFQVKLYGTSTSLGVTNDLVLFNYCLR